MENTIDIQYEKDSCPDLLTVHGSLKNVSKKKRRWFLTGLIVPTLPFFYYICGILILGNDPSKQPELLIGSLGVSFIFFELLSQPWNQLSKEEFTIFSSGKIDYKEATRHTVFNLDEITKVVGFRDVSDGRFSFCLDFHKKVHIYLELQFGRVYVGTKYLPIDRKRAFEFLLTFQKDYGFEVILKKKD